MTKLNDIHSKRSEKRANRNFTASRPNRRANHRLAVAMAGYDSAFKASQTGGMEFTKPGAKKHW